MPKPFLFPGLYIVLITFITSCTASTSAPFSSCNDSSQTVIPIHAVTGDTLNLYLDSLMVMGVQTPVDYSEKDSTLFVFDSYNKRLLEYPFAPAKGMARPLYVQAVHLNNKIAYMKYLNRDSIVLYAYGPFQLFYYAIGKNSIYRKVPMANPMLHNRPDFNPAPPFALPSSPIIFKGNTAIGVGYLMGESKEETMAGRTTCTIVDLGNNRLTYKVPYSSIYATANWGGSHMRTPYAAYNAEKQQLVLSLPADHNVQIIDSAWHIKEVPAYSREKTCITALTLAKDNKNMGDAEYALRYFTSTPSYRNIIFDKYRNRYYRILQLPPPAEALKKNGVAEKPARLIAFDKDFHYLGEAPLPAGLALDNFFVTAKGLYFLNKTNNQENVGQYLQIRVEI